MSSGNRVKQALANGETVFAMWANLGSAQLCEAAVWSGFPVILLDNEHGTASLSQTLQVLRAVEGAGGELVVRAPLNDEVYIKKLIDIGVRSLMLPMVNSPKAAEKAAAACRYPPQGARSFAAPIVRGSRYGFDADYGRTINEDILLIVQIEHVDAVASIEAIAAIDGVDMLFIGPNDLAGSIGKTGVSEDADFIALFEDAAARIAQTGKSFGCIPFGRYDTKALAAMRCQFIVGASDITLFTGAARTEARRQADLCPMIADALKDS